ncbi:MAG: septal ring lytic transglycosylase RlpA family protein [Acidobacteriota bacterium]
MRFSNLFLILLIVFLSLNCSSEKIIFTEPDSDKDLVGRTSENGPVTSDVKEYNKNKNNENDDFYQVGIASWYGDKFNGRRTSNGEIYDMYKLTAAHKKLPFNTLVEVENLNNRKKILVRINDRGPFVKKRIIDLSYKAAIAIDMDDEGTAPVVLRIMDMKDIKGRGKILTQKRKYSFRSKFVLQAGAFENKNNAESLRDNINYNSLKIKFKITFENGFYKVLSDTISSRNETEKYKKFLENIGFDLFIKEIFHSN